MKLPGWLPRLIFCLTSGKATRPLRLPVKALPCFDSQKEWDLFRESANYSAGNGFTPCSDCTAARQAKMIAAARCKFPKTIFVRQTGGVTVGRRVK